MRIDVVVSGWEQSCCGQAFAVGTPATLSIVAVDPVGTTPDAPARFLEEHHGQTPTDVPQWDVTGTVVRITGVNYEHRLRPGPHPVTERGTAVTASAELAEVPARSTGGYNDLQLVLDVDDDTVLPSFHVSAQSLAADAVEADAAETRRLRRTDPTGIQLFSIAAEIEAAYGHVARIERDDDRTAVAIEPLSAGAASISWARYTTADSDVIAVKLGEGRFSFPADREHTEDLRELIAAAAAGRVHETVRNDDAAIVLETVAESTDGRTWTDSKTETPFRVGGDVVMMGGRLAARLGAGDHGYEPWTS